MAVNRSSSTIGAKDRKLVTYSNVDSLVSEQFRAIRTNINFLTKEKQKRTFLITSPGKGEGKTTTAANLAISMAQQKESVLLIDTNLRNPVIHDLFKLSNNTGLADMLESESAFSLEEVAQHSGIGNLDVLTGGLTLSNPAELLGDEKMELLLKEIKERYDIVLIDSPNVLESTESLILAHQCDGVIMVFRRGKTRTERTGEAVRLLEIARAPIVGAIMNER